MATRIRVLLVDDNEAFRASAGRFLSRQACCDLVGTASSGEEALARVGSIHPDLVLLDVAMPGLNGLEVTRRLKQSGDPARVVMVTIHDEADYRIAAHEAGADGFIVKTDFTLQVISLLRDLAGAETGP